ncbi:MAG: Hsp20/alpha crystallin family protein [Desulfosalsimonadaceae bacterium]
MLDKLIPWRKKQRDGDALPYNEKRPDLFGMDSFLPGFPFLRDDWLIPRVDITESRRNVTVKAEIPGVDKKDIDISIDNNVLRIKGEKHQEKEEKDENYYRMESGYGFFSRTIELPAPVDPDSVDAKYKRGVLTVRMKKTKESQSRKIQIQSG